MSDEIHAPGADRDLLGDPVDANKTHWGRPGFEITKENQQLVSVLKAAGWKNERIARRLGCDAKTLRKHFSLELDTAADQLEAEALVSIASRMREGNIAAARQVLQLAEKGRAAPPPPPPDKAPEDEPAAKLGKKEQLAAAAKLPGASWGGLLPH